MDFEAATAIARLVRSSIRLSPQPETQQQLLRIRVARWGESQGYNRKKLTRLLGIAMALYRRVNIDPDPPKVLS